MISATKLTRVSFPFWARFRGEFKIGHEKIDAQTKIKTGEAPKVDDSCWISLHFVVKLMSTIVYKKFLRGTELVCESKKAALFSESAEIFVGL